MPTAELDDLPVDVRKEVLPIGYVSSVLVRANFAQTSVREFSAWRVLHSSFQPPRHQSCSGHIGVEPRYQERPTTALITLSAKTPLHVQKSQLLVLIHLRLDHLARFFLYSACGE